MKITFFLLFIFVTSLVPRPGSGGSYKSSSSSRSSSYRPYRTSHSSSNAPQSFMTTSSHEPSNKYYKSEKIQAKNYKISFFVRENLIVDVEENFQFETKDKQEFVYSFLNEVPIYEYFFHKYNFKQKDKIPLIQVKQGKENVLLASEQAKVYYHSSTLEAVFIKAPQNQTLDIVTHFELEKTFLYDTQTNSYILFLPIHHYESKGLENENIEFELNLDAKIQEIENISIATNPWDESIALNIKQERKQKYFGNISKRTEEPLFLIFSISSKFVNNENVFDSMKEGLKNKDSHFSKMIHEMQIQQNSEIHHKIKIEIPEPIITNTISFMVFNYPISKSFGELLQTHNKKVYLLEPITSNSTSSYYYTSISNYNFSIPQSEFIELQYKTYGAIFEDEKNQILLYSMPHINSFSTEDYELQITFPSQVNMKNAKLEFPEFLSTPVSIQQENQQIFLTAKWIQNVDLLEFQIQLPKNTLESIPIYESLYLDFIYHLTFERQKVWIFFIGVIGFTLVSVFVLWKFFLKK